jgi:glucose/arabinose dehydrogenase
VKPGTTVDYAGLTAAAGQALPPTSGPREANPLPDSPAFSSRAAAPRPERAVGNLNHGYIVVWYDNQLPDQDVKTLQTAVASNTRTLVVPWTRSIFPDGRHVVLTAWDRTQRCTMASTAVITDFANSYRDLSAAQQGWASPSAPTPSGAGGSTPTPKPTTKPTTLPTPSVKPTGQASAAAPSSAAPAGPSPKITVSPER